MSRINPLDRVVYLVDILRFAVDDFSQLATLFEVSHPFRDAIENYSQDVWQFLVSNKPKNQQSYCLSSHAASFLTQYVFSRSLMSLQRFTPTTGRLWLLKGLLGPGAIDLNGKVLNVLDLGQDECSLLSLAVQAKNRGAAKLLLLLGAALDNASGRSGVLHEACKQGNVKMLDVLLTTCTHRFDINAVKVSPTTGRATELPGTPLHYAVRCKSLECCRLLLEHGADVDAVDSQKRPVTSEWLRGRSVGGKASLAIMQLQLEHGCSLSIPPSMFLTSLVDRKSTNNATLVHTAAVADDPEFLALLLQHFEKSPIVDLKEAFLERPLSRTDTALLSTPVMLAVEAGVSFRTVEMLIDAGAKIDRVADLREPAHEFLHMALPDANAVTMVQPVLAVALAVSKGRHGGGPFRELLKERGVDEKLLHLAHWFEWLLFLVS